MANPKGIPVPFLRAWRQHKILGTRELAALAGITSAAISRIEAGHNASYTTVGKLAGALGISREDLVRRNPSPPSKSAA